MQLKYFPSSITNLLLLVTVQLAACQRAAIPCQPLAHIASSVVALPWAPGPGEAATAHAIATRSAARLVQPARRPAERPAVSQTYWQPVFHRQSGASFTAPQFGIDRCKQLVIRPLPATRPAASGAPRLQRPAPYHKGVAVALAVVLGLFGAHLFYLGHHRRAMGYLLAVLICLSVMALAIPAASWGVFGGGLGSALFAIYLLVLGILGLALVYCRALIDAIRILTGDLT